MELEFPPELLAACGRHRFGIYVISNDIPAAEISAVGCHNEAIQRARSAGR